MQFNFLLDLRTLINYKTIINIIFKNLFFSLKKISINILLIFPILFKFDSIKKVVNICYRLKISVMLKFKRNN